MRVGAYEERMQSMGIILSCFGYETEATGSVAFRQSGSLSESDIRLSGSDHKEFLQPGVRIRSRTLLPCGYVPLASCMAAQKPFVKSCE
jgi:hypothetical protein